MSLQAPEDQDIVIVGATGDLARRKLLPAFYNMHLEGLLPAQGKIIGYARTGRSDDEFRGYAADAMKEFSRTGLDDKAWAAFAERLTFVAAEPDGFAGILRCQAHQQTPGPGQTASRLRAVCPPLNPARLRLVLWR